MNLEKDLIILKNIFKDMKGKGLKLEEITKILGWSSKYKKENRIIVDEWVNSGELIKNNRGKYNLPETQGIIKGKMNIIKDRFAFVDTDEFSVFIPRSEFNGALDGDVVQVQITNIEAGDRKKEGKVIKIIQREKDTIIGIFQRNKNFGFVTPIHSFGKDIYIPSNKMKGYENNQLVVVKIFFWGDSERKPEGEIIEALGNPEDSKNMIEGLLIREGLEEEFSAEVKKEIKYIPQRVEEKDRVGRKDLRNLDIITIDGADAKDLDDAVYLEKLKNGNFKLYVSIADVSYYVKEGSALDKEASKRGNSVYLVDRVLPMFPKELSNGICSLNPNEDKLTFTCEMEINASGKVVDFSTYKSVINTKYRMTYDEVNEIIEKNENTMEKYADIVPMIDEMLGLSKILREIKYKRGSIDFDLPELKIVLDDDEKVAEVKLRERKEAERIIEDFMIIANEVVAEKLFWLEIPSVYRVHEKPDLEKLTSLNEILAKFNYRVHISEEIYPKEFQKIIELSKEDGNNMLIHKLILMSLKQARYSTENSGHFGLASNYYTHFTSPIRRYADLCVHRVLSSVLDSFPSKKVLAKNSEILPSICESISKAERLAMKVEEESKKIKLVEYMKNKVGNTYMGTIVGFSNKKIFLETEEYIEGFIDVISLKGYYEFDENTYTMKNIDTGKIYSLGDKHEIVVARVSMRELEIEFSFIE